MAEFGRPGAGQRQQQMRMGQMQQLQEGAERQTQRSLAQAQQQFENVLAQRQLTLQERKSLVRATQTFNIEGKLVTVEKETGEILNVQSVTEDFELGDIKEFISSRERLRGQPYTASERVSILGFIEKASVAGNRKDAVGIIADGLNELEDKGAKADEKEAARSLTKRGQDITIRGQNLADLRARELAELSRGEKAERELAGEQQRLSSFDERMDRLALAANQLLLHPGLKGITGITGALPVIPGTDRADATAILLNLKSQVGFSVLQELRTQSKTGGALGQVSDKENELLQENLAALDQAQTFKQFQESLKQIIKFTENAKERARKAIEETGGKRTLMKKGKLGSGSLNPRE